MPKLVRCISFNAKTHSPSTERMEIISSISCFIHFISLITDGQLAKLSCLEHSTLRKCPATKLSFYKKQRFDGLFLRRTFVPTYSKRLAYGILPSFIEAISALISSMLLFNPLSTIAVIAPSTKAESIISTLLLSSSKKSKAICAFI